MNSKYIIPIAIFAALLLAGCSTVNKGRFSVVDLDLRTPEQITAQVPEKTVIYGSTNAVPVQVAAQPRAFPFELLFQFLQVMKGRLMIFSLEWETK